ncbi:MAG TPA: extracellular solute-binding protein [Firmicutes bacterium]|jgi:multiple sugar transport system substrate-binding protein|nr:extracellular solute-binding protein [Bacillota bacterium]
MRTVKWAPCLLLILMIILPVSRVSAAPIELVFMHRSATKEAEWAQEIARRFNETHPGIHVTTLSADSGPGGAWYIEKLTVLRASGMSPDVYYGASDKMGFVLQGWTLDLTPFVTRDAAELRIDTFFPGVWNSFALNGRVYGVPLAVTPQFMFYNKGMLANHGLAPLPTDWDVRFWTWDDFVDYGRKLTRQEGDGTYSQVALSRAGENQLPDICWIFGGDWFSEAAYAQGKAAQATMLRAENINAYNALIDYYAKYAAAGPPKGIDPGMAFVNERAAMEWIGAWRINGFLSAQLSWEWGIGPMPMVATRANTRWTDPLFISDDTKCPEQAWEFVKYATGSEAQALWSEITGMIPARRTAMDAYTQSVMAATGMSAPEVTAAIGGALAHSRRALEESIPAAHRFIVDHMQDWFAPMMDGEVAVSSALEQIQNLLNNYLAGL